MRATQISTVTEEITNLVLQKLGIYRVVQSLVLTSRDAEYLLGQWKLMNVITVLKIITFTLDVPHQAMNVACAASQILSLFRNYFYSFAGVMTSLWRLFFDFFLSALKIGLYCLYGKIFFNL